MDQNQSILNRFLVDMFNEILKAEELTLSKKYKNLSLKEFHVIEAVCIANENGSDNSTAAIAENLRITAGSLTVAVNTLESKNYLYRQKIDKDKRIVRLFATELGVEVNKYHSSFHIEMVDNVLSTISEEETVILLKTLGSISAFFRSKYTHNKED